MDELSYFVLLVDKMRNRQKEYLKTRDCQVLIESIELEKAVDEKIKEIRSFSNKFYLRGKNGIRINLRLRQ